MSTALRTGRRSSRSHRVLLVAVGLLVVLAALDMAVGSVLLVVPLFVLAPLLVAVWAAPARETALVAVVALVLALVSGALNGALGTTEWLVAVLTVAGGGLAAVVAATARGRFQHDAERLELLVALGDVAPAATVEATAARLAELLVPAVADACVVDLPAEEGRAGVLAVRVADALGPGAERRVREALPPVGPSADAPPGADAVLVDHVADPAACAGLRACVTAPLQSGGRAVGTLRMGVAPPRRYGPRDLRFAEVVADRVALALENAGLSAELLDAERRFEAIVDGMVDGVMLRAADGRLVYANAAAIDLLRVESAEVLHAMRRGEAMALFDVFDEAGRPVSLDDLPSVRAWTEPDDPEPMIVRNVVRATGEQRWLLSKATAIRDGDGRPLYVVDFIEDLTAVKRAELGQRLLAEAGRVLVSSLDHERTLQQVALLAVPELADWCGVDMPGRHGMIESVAIGHADAGSVALVRAMRARHRMRLDGPDGVAAVLRGEIAHEVVDEMPEDVLVARAADEEHLALMRQVGLNALMVVPMAGRSGIVGTLTFGSRKAGRFDAEDLALAEELGRRAGIAVENARLYAERADIAHTLQVALVPDPVPLAPGWDVAALYRPAGEATEAGGDFYDMVRTDDGWLMVMGDVTGKGARAASVTSLARYTLRTAAMLTGDPAAALAALNLGLMRRGDVSFCTAAMVSLSELDDGRARVRVLSAGHPLPVLIQHGAARALGRPGPLLGAVEAARWPAVEAELGPGDRVVLYTDGVTDTRGVDERFGDARLLDVLVAADGTPPAALVRRIEQALGAFEDGPQRDDTALLAVTRLHPGELALPGGPESVSLARAALRTRLEPHLSAERLADVLLMASEVVTNAVRHGRAIGPSDRIRVRIHEPAGRLRVEVRDAGPGFAPPPADSSAREGGMGLKLVERLSLAWAAEREGSTTKVWFEVDPERSPSPIH